MILPVLLIAKASKNDYDGNENLGGKDENWNDENETNSLLRTT